MLGLIDGLCFLPAQYCTNILPYRSRERIRGTRSLRLYAYVLSTSTGPLGFLTVVDWGERRGHQTILTSQSLFSLTLGVFRNPCTLARYRTNAQPRRCQGAKELNPKYLEKDEGEKEVPKTSIRRVHVAQMHRDPSAASSPMELSGNFT